MSEEGFSVSPSPLFSFLLLTAARLLAWGRDFLASRSSLAEARPEPLSFLTGGSTSFGPSILLAMKEPSRSRLATTCTFTRSATLPANWVSRVTLIVASPKEAVSNLTSPLPTAVTLPSTSILHRVGLRIHRHQGRSERAWRLLYRALQPSPSPDPRVRDRKDSCIFGQGVSPVCWHRRDPGLTFVCGDDEDVSLHGVQNSLHLSFRWRGSQRRVAGKC